MAKAGLTDMGGNGKSGRVVTRATKRRRVVLCHPTSGRVFTRSSRVSTSSLPPSLIGRRLGGCACLTSGRLSLFIPLVNLQETCICHGFLHLHLWIQTAGRVVGSLAASSIRSSVRHSFVVVVHAVLLVNGKLRLQVRVLVPGQIHPQQRLSQFRIARLLKEHLPE